MSMKKLFTGIFLSSATLVFGQFGQFEDPVSVSASVGENARAGEVVEVQVIFSIDKGWYIY